MKPRQSVILLALVAAAVTAIVVYEYVLEPREAEKKQEQNLFFPDLDAEGITRLEAMQGDTTRAVLVREGDTTWKVESSGGYPADRGDIKTALDSLAEIEKGVLASHTEQGHVELGVDRGLLVKAYVGDEVVAELVLGKSGKGGSVYARKAGEKETWLVTNNIKYLFDKDSDEWRDDEIFSIRMDQIDRIILSSTADSDTTEPQQMILDRDRGAGEWMLMPADGDTAQKLSKSKADSLARSLINLTARDFEDDVTLEEAGLVNPSRKAEILLESGEKLTLLVGDEKNSFVYVKRPDRDVVFSVYKSSVNNIFKQKEQLLPETEDDEQGEEKGDPASFLPAPPLEQGK